MTSPSPRLPTPQWRDRSGKPVWSGRWDWDAIRVHAERNRKALRDMEAMIVEDAK